MSLLVLVEQRLWPEFVPAVRGLGERWTASSGRSYTLTVDGSRLEVRLEHGDLEPPPPGDELDADLLELAGAVYDAAEGEWSADVLRGIAALWGWSPQ